MSADKKKKLKILLGASYHANNHGDLALLDTYAKRLKKEFPASEITVFSYNPKYIRENYKGVVDRSYFVVNGFRTFFEILRTDILVLGGGGIIFDYSLFDTFSLVKKSQILHWLLISIFASWTGKKIVWSGLGIGPITTGFSRWLLKLTLPKVDSITVRDRASKELLEEIAKKPLSNLKQTADIVWTWRENPPFYPAKKAQNTVVLSPRTWNPTIDARILKKYTNFAKILNKGGYKFEILPTHPKKDFAISKKLAENLRELNIPVSFDENIQNHTLENLYKKISSSRLVVSMRMHALIFSSTLGIPGIGIDYKTPKVTEIDKMLTGVRSFKLKTKSTEIAEWAATFLKDSKVYRAELLDQTKRLSDKAKINLDEIKQVAENPKGKKDRTLLQIAQILISILLLYLLSRRISIVDSLEIIKQADFSLIFLAFILKIIAVYPSSSIWRRSLAFLAKKQPVFTFKDRWNAFITYIQSYFFDNFGLGSLGGDIYRAVQKKSFGGIESAGSVVLERVSGAAFLFWLAISMFIQTTILQKNDSLLSFILFGVGLIVAPLLLTLGLKAVVLGQGVFKFLAPKVKPLKKIAEFQIAPNYKTSFEINLRAAVFYLISAFSFMLTTQSVGLSLTLSEALFIFTTLLFVASLPISYQGIGLRDVSLAGLLAFVGKGAEAAIAISTILLISKIVLSLVGGIVFLLYRGNRESVKEAVTV